MKTLAMSVLFCIFFHASLVSGADKVIVVPLMKNTSFTVARTGQSECYSNFPGTLVDCTGTGQDGEFQKGAPWPVPRFTDNGNGTVTDHLTGLMWLKDTNCMHSDIPGFDHDDTNAVGEEIDYDIYGDGKVSREHAFDFITGLNSGGTFFRDDGTMLRTKCGGAILYDDWRLPNRSELLSLVDLSQTDPALPTGHPFDNVERDFYWSSSYSAAFYDMGVGWVVNISTGGIVYQKSWNLQSALVWPVRGGE